MVEHPEGPPEPTESESDSEPVDDIKPQVEVIHKAKKETIEETDEMRAAKALAKEEAKLVCFLI